MQKFDVVGMCNSHQGNQHSSNYASNAIMLFEHQRSHSAHLGRCCGARCVFNRSFSAGLRLCLFSPISGRIYSYLFLGYMNLYCILFTILNLCLMIRDDKSEI